MKNHSPSSSANAAKAPCCDRCNSANGLCAENQSLCWTCTTEDSLCCCAAEAVLETFHHQANTDDPRLATKMELAISGMTCTNCASSVERALRAVDGVVAVSVSIATDSAVVEFRSNNNTTFSMEARFKEAIEAIGYTVESATVLQQENKTTTTTTTSSYVRAEFVIAGMTCTNCASSVTAAIEALSGIQSVSVSLATDSAIVEWDASLNSTKNDYSLVIQEAIEDIGYDVTSIAILNNDNKATITDESPSTTTAHHPNDNVGERWDQLQDRQARKVKDRKDAFVWSLAGTVPILVLTMVLPYIFPVWLQPLEQTTVDMAHHTVRVETLLLWILATPVQFGSGWEFYKMSWHALKSSRAGMDVLVALGTTASYAYAFYGGIWEGVSPDQSTDSSMASHFFETSVTLISFVLAGKWMQAMAVRRTSQALSKLMALQSKTAVRITPMNKKNKTGSAFDPTVDAYTEQVVDIQAIQVGDLVKVIRGAKIPADGKIVYGELSVDESMVTGESVPVLKQVDSVVIGGTVCVEANASGMAVIQVSGVGANSALAQIVKLVSDAQTQAVPVQAFAEQIAAIFVPTVVIVSIATFVIWYLLCSTGVVPAEWYESRNENPLTFSIMFGIACLVISCPCALGLATPTAVMVGTGVGANLGVLIKGGEALETASAVNAVVFDKTGTLTQGSPSVTDFVRVADLKKKKVPKEFQDANDYLIWLLACLEKTSEHPLAKAVVEYADSKLDQALLKDKPYRPPTDFKALTGRGASATVDGFHVAAGNRAFAAMLGLTISEETERTMTLMENHGKTAIVAVVNGTIVAVLGIADDLKPDAAAALRYLQNELKVQVWMVTGDNTRTAHAISRRLGLPADRVIAEALPASKVEQVRKLQDQGLVVAMVGDGINDAPALAQADVGVSIGSGTEIAAEAADMVLVKGKVKDVATALHLSRTIFRRIQWNLLFSLLYNVLGIPVAAGLFYPIVQTRLPPTVAAVAMALSSLSVVASSLALRLYQAPNLGKDILLDRNEDDIYGFLEHRFEEFTKKIFQRFQTPDKDAPEQHLLLADYTSISTRNGSSYGAVSGKDTSALGMIIV